MSNKILRFRQVIECTGLSRSTLYNRMDPKSKSYDPSFPKPSPLGARLVGWSSKEIDQWVEETLSHQ